LVGDIMPGHYGKKGGMKMKPKKKKKKKKK
jgi:hypothetical protein